MFPEGIFSPWHLMLLGIITLVVVGPKDLPAMMRKVGQFVAKMRGMANEFRASFDELARQSELEELRKEVEAMRVSQQTVISQLNPLTDTQSKTVFDDIGQHLNTPVASPAVMTALPSAEPAAVETTVSKPVRAPRAKAAKAVTPRARAAPAKSAPAKAAAARTPKAAPAKTKAKTAQAVKAPAKPRAKAAATASDAS